VETDNEKIQKRRAPVKARAKENKMADVMEDQPIGASSQEEPSLPDEWISIAAYYIWKSEENQRGATLIFGIEQKPN
jgi:hypothetical protein